MTSDCVYIDEVDFMQRKASIMKKYRILVLSAILLLLSLSACGVSNRLSVASEDYPGLTVLHAAAFDAAAEDEGLKKNPGFAHDEPMCVVSVQDGVLQVNDFDPYPHIVGEYFGAWGTFVGVSSSMAAGYVQFFESAYPIIQSEKTQLVSGVGCLALVKDTENRGLLVTSGLEEVDGAYTLNGHLYRIGTSAPLENPWRELEPVGYPQAAYYDRESNMLYVVNKTGVWTVDAADKMTFIEASDTFETLTVNSAAVLDGVLYCGCYTGVYAVNLATGEETFYRMDFEKYAGE